MGYSGYCLRKPIFWFSKINVNIIVLSHLLFYLLALNHRYRMMEGSFKRRMRNAMKHLQEEVGKMLCSCVKLMLPKYNRQYKNEREGQGWRGWERERENGQTIHCGLCLSSIVIIGFGSVLYFWNTFLAMLAVQEIHFGAMIKASD